MTILQKLKQLVVKNIPKRKEPQKGFYTPNVPIVYSKRPQFAKDLGIGGWSASPGTSAAKAPLINIYNNEGGMNPQQFKKWRTEVAEPHEQGHAKFDMAMKAAALHPNNLLEEDYDRQQLDYMGDFLGTMKREEPGLYEWADADIRSAPQIYDPRDKYSYANEMYARANENVKSNWEDYYGRPELIKNKLRRYFE